MMLQRSVQSTAATLAGLVLSAVVSTSCGLVSSDIGTINFQLPARMYAFDTAPWGLPSGTLPAAPCATAADCCTAAAAVGYSCAADPLACDAGSCSMTKTFEAPPQSVNLQAAAPSSLSSQSVVDVSISKITYDVTSTMNVPLPPVELFLAPDGVTSSTDARATKFGTVPMIPAGAAVTGGQVALEPSAGATFAGYAHNFGTPFTFLARTTVKVGAGAPFPMGRVDITVSGVLSAKPNL
jgi:hypothetical protein